MLKHQEYFLYLLFDNSSYKYDGIGNEGQPNKSWTADESARNCCCYIGLETLSLGWEGIKGCHGDKKNCKSRCLTGFIFAAPNYF